MCFFHASFRLETRLCLTDRFALCRWSGIKPHVSGHSDICRQRFQPTEWLAGGREGSSYRTEKVCPLFLAGFCLQFAFKIGQREIYSEKGSSRKKIRFLTKRVFLNDCFEFHIYLVHPFRRSNPKIPFRTKFLGRKLTVIHDIFSSRPVKVIRLVARSTVEEIVLKRADDKLKLTNTVIEGGKV